MFPARHCYKGICAISLFVFSFMFSPAQETPQTQRHNPASRYLHSDFGPVVISDEPTNKPEYASGQIIIKIRTSTPPESLRMQVQPIGPSRAFIPLFKKYAVREAVRVFPEAPAPPPFSGKLFLESF